MARTDPINPTSPEAIAQAQSLLAQARFGALAVTWEGAPYVTRISTIAIDGAAHILISALSVHTRALKADPACALLIGEPGGKGDPLTHPRMTLIGRASVVDKAAARDAWLTAIPKAQLYYDFADFEMWRIGLSAAHLNGGFGKAFHLTPADMTGPSTDTY